MQRMLALAAAALLAGCAGTEAPAPDAVEPTGPVEVGGSTQEAAIAAGGEQVFEVAPTQADVVGFSVEVQRTSIEPTRVVVEVHSNGTVEQETFFLSAIAGRGEVATGTMVAAGSDGMTVLARAIDGEAVVRVRAQEANLAPEGAPESNVTQAYDPALYP